MTRTRFVRTWLPVLGAAGVFLVGWKLLVIVGGYPQFILPAPEVVGQRLIQAWTDGTMEPHAVATVSEMNPMV